jgi:hypothetical protein
MREGGVVKADRQRRRLSPRAQARVAGCLLTAVVACLVLESWYPFTPQLPVWTRTGPSRTNDGSARFDGSSILISRRPQAWVSEASRTGAFHIALELRAARKHQAGPARILTVSRNYFASNVTIAQNRSDLLVRLRRPGASPSGEPPLHVPGLVGDLKWHHVELRVSDQQATIVADGQPVLRERLGAEALANWNPRFAVALGDEPSGERGWAGDLRVAKVATTGHVTNLLAAGVLEPGEGIRRRSRTLAIFEVTPHDSLAISIARLLVFVPLGAIVQWRWRRRRTTLAVACAVSALLLVGKVFVAGRDPVLADAILGVVGAIVGGFVSERLAQRLAGRPVGA